MWPGHFQLSQCMQVRPWNEAISLIRTPWLVLAGLRSLEGEGVHWQTHWNNTTLSSPFSASNTWLAGSALYNPIYPRSETSSTFPWEGSAESLQRIRMRTVGPRSWNIVLSRRRTHVSGVPSDKGPSKKRNNLFTKDITVHSPIVYVVPTVLYSEVPLKSQIIL